MISIEELTRRYGETTVVEACGVIHHDLSLEQNARIIRGERAAAQIRYTVPSVAAGFQESLDDFAGLLR